MRVVLDEDIPRAFGGVLEDAGFEVIDIRDRNLRGASDEEVFHFTRKHKALLLTEDLGFTNPARFNLSSIKGILLTRLPQTLPLERRLNELKILLRSIDGDSLVGFITVFEVGRIRRRPLTVMPR